jgi:hypothetical protein
MENKVQGKMDYFNFLGLVRYKVVVRLAGHEPIEGVIRQVFKDYFVVFETPSGEKMLVNRDAIQYITGIEKVPDERKEEADGS